jgi:DNA-binding NtrC family response regulator
MQGSNEWDTSAATADRALIFSSNPSIGRSLRDLLLNNGWQVDDCETTADFLRLVMARQWPLVLIYNAPGAAFEQEALDAIRREVGVERTLAVVLAELPTTEEAMFWAELGADYYGWPVMPAQVLALAGRARRMSCTASSELDAAPAPTKGERTGNGAQRTMIGSSPAMLELSKRLVRVAKRHDHPVFISGETGVGKEVIARQLHQKSGRTGPFRAINCASIVESLLESELFGHEKGAFTGASATKRGLWEDAAQGTLFLDEITEAPPLVQSKLLRVMQEGVIQRVGSAHEIKVTARVVAASNRDLEAAVKEGTLRQDLFHRFKEVLHVSPLRERPEDIAPLVEHFCAREGNGMVIAPAALELLCAYEWPGNVRELENVIGKLATHFGRRIYPDDVLQIIPSLAGPRDRSPDLSAPSVMQALACGKWPTAQEHRDSYVVAAYAYFQSEAQVAKALGMDYRTVNAILRKEEERQRRESEGGESNVIQMFPDGDRGRKQEGQAGEFTGGFLNGCAPARLSAM